MTEAPDGAHQGDVLAVASPDPKRTTEASGVRPQPLTSFEEVYRTHFAFVWRSARRLGVGDDVVDDVVQEVFLVVHRKLGEFEGRSRLETWLFAITRRVISDHRRSARQRRPHTPLPESLACQGTPHRDAVRQEAACVLHDFLDALPDEQREVFVLAELEQMTAPEIAEATSTKVNTVYSRLRLARESFERCVARQRARAGRGS